MIKKIMSILAVSGIVFMCWLAIEANTRIQQSQAHYNIQPGTSLTKLAYELQQHHLIKHPRSFILLGQVLGVSDKIQAGEYEIVAGTTHYQLMKDIVNGKVKHYKITFVEGTTFKQWLQDLHLQPHLAHTLNALNMEAILAELNITQLSAEGLFYPETYYFVKGDSDVDVLAQAKHTMQTILTQEWAQRAAELPYQTPYQALIAASLIEKETANANERAIMAGILIKRLEQGMLLQFDPTVIYGLGGDYHQPLTRKQLRQDTPYNTYMHKGLPPTPIAMPSQASIHAALHPQITDYLYFVAQGDGSHVFSKTLAEHRIAVKRYREVTNGE